MGGPPAVSANEAERPVTVLLVDDQAIVGESVRRLLASEPDIVLHFCQDPAQAIPTANAVGPTVILQDLVLIATGLLVAEALRAQETLENEGVSVRVIDIHTIKPIDREALLDAIRRCCSGEHRGVVLVVEDDAETRELTLTGG